MSTVDLRPTGAAAAGRVDWQTRALSVAIAFLLFAGAGAAAARTAEPGTSAATAEDLQLIKSSTAAVQDLEAIEITARFEFNGQTTTMEGSGDATGGRFTLSVPGVDEFEYLQVGNRSYLPAFTQPGWVEFVGPEGMAASPADAVAGQDPLDYLRSISSTGEVEVLGEDSVEGDDVTRYRMEIPLADALRAAGADASSFGLSEAELAQMLSEASPMRIELALDDAGIPRRTSVEYEIQGIDFRIETSIRPIAEAPALEAPPAAEIVSSHTGTDLVHFQQLIGSHIAQYAMR